MTRVTRMARHTSTMATIFDSSVYIHVHPYFTYSALSLYPSYTAFTHDKNAYSYHHHYSSLLCIFRFREKEHARTAKLCVTLTHATLILVWAVTAVVSAITEQLWRDTRTTLAPSHWTGQMVTPSGIRCKTQRGSHLSHCNGSQYTVYLIYQHLVSANSALWLVRLWPTLPLNSCLNLHKIYWGTISLWLFQLTWLKSSVVELKAPVVVDKVPIAAFKWDVHPSLTWHDHVVRCAGTTEVHYDSTISMSVIKVLNTSQLLGALKSTYQSLIRYCVRQQRATEDHKRCRKLYL